MLFLGAGSKERLVGGRSEIFKEGAEVYRPKPFNHAEVHKFLNYLRSRGSRITPKVIGTTETQEILSFMKGTVYNELPPALQTDRMLETAARLLREFHDFSEGYVQQLEGNEQWLLPAQAHVELICHGDFAPYNVTIVGECAKAIIDFDTIHPGSAMWDISYAIYRWVPFEAGGDLQEQIRKAKVFLVAYDSEWWDNETFVYVLTQRLEALVQFMQKEAEAGNETFKQNIEDGHMQKYLEDIEYLKVNREAIESGVR